MNISICYSSLSDIPCTLLLTWSCSYLTFSFSHGDCYSILSLNLLIWEHASGMTVMLSAKYYHQSCVKPWNAWRSAVADADQIPDIFLIHSILTMSHPSYLCNNNKKKKTWCYSTLLLGLEEELNGLFRDNYDTVSAGTFTEICQCDCYKLSWEVSQNHRMKWAVNVTLHRRKIYTRTHRAAEKQHVVGWRKNMSSWGSYFCRMKPFHRQE